MRIGQTGEKMPDGLKIPDCGHSRDPLVSCALEGVASIVAGIEDAAIVIHSPQGCSATVAQAYDEHEIDFTRRKIACSRLFEKDIILGASQKLRDLIIQADKTFGAAVIFVVGTCAADIIGEDVEAICRDVGRETAARLVPIMAGGFRGDAYAGMDLGLKAILPLVKAPRPPGLEVRPRDAEWEGGTSPSPSVGAPAVNLLLPQANLNPTWWADAEWARSVISEMGIGPCAFLPRGTSSTDLPEAGKAQAHILLSHDAGFEFAAELEKGGSRWELRDLPLPLGLENTARWLRAMGTAFGAEAAAERLIARGEERVTGILRKRGLMLIPRYRNCRVAICADATIGIPLLRALYLELEMIPELLLLRGSSRGAVPVLERELSDLGLNPKVVLDADGWQMREALRESRADAVIGSAWEAYIAEELGIKIAFDVVAPTNRDRYLDRAYFGYEGYLNLLEAMGNDWEGALRSKKIEWEQYAE